MNRYWILGLLLVGGVWTLVWLVRDLGSEMRDFDDAIRDGGRSITKRSGPIPGRKTPTLERSRFAKDEILALHLPADHPDATRFGTQLLSLRGNNVLFARPTTGSLHWTRSILNRTDADDLLRGLLAEQPAPSAGAHRAVIVSEGKRVERGVPAAKAKALIEAKRPRSGTWVPEVLKLELRTVEGDAEALPWPVPKPAPDSFVGKLGDFPAPRGLIGTLIEKWSPGVVLKDRQGRRFEIVRVAVPLP